METRQARFQQYRSKTKLHLLPISMKYAQSPLSIADLHMENETVSRAPAALDLSSKFVRSRAALPLALCCSTLLGCVITLGTQIVMSNNSADLQTKQAKRLLIPTPWRIGDWWMYSVDGSKAGDPSIVYAVVSSTEGGDYTLGTTSLHEAQKQALSDTFPFLGRIGREDRSVFADGRPQKLLPFPLSADTIFGFSLFEQEWSAVVSTARAGTAQIVARGSSGDRLVYSYSYASGYIDELIWTLVNGQVALKIEMIKHGVGYVGESWCVRATSIFDSRWKETLKGASSIEQASSFDVSHEDAQEQQKWDHLLIDLSVKTGSDGVALLSIRPSNGEATVQHRFGHNLEVLKGIVGLKQPDKKYVATLVSEGESALELHVAKAITNHWTLM